MNATDPRTVDVVRTFPVPVARLFQLCASPAFFRRTGAKVNGGSMDFREGGSYRYAFESGGEVWGEFQQIVRNERIVMSWSTDHADGGCADGHCADTTLELTFRDLGESSELHLVHRGFAEEKPRASHEEGWRDVLGTLEVDFNGQLGAAIQAGIEPRFKIRQRFPVPVARVFHSFVDEGEITRFFVQATTGPLATGQRVRWTFSGYEPFVVFCQEVTPNERIRFTWGHAHVRFEFEDLGEHSRVTVHCEGWEPTPAGLADSYEECEGWRHVLLTLRVLLEHGITIDTPECGSYA